MVRPQGQHQKVTPLRETDQSMDCPVAGIVRCRSKLLASGRECIGLRILAFTIELLLFVLVGVLLFISLNDRSNDHLKERA